MRYSAVILLLTLLACAIAGANPGPPYEEYCRVTPQDQMANPRIIGIPAGGTAPHPMARIEVQMFDFSWQPWAGVDVWLLVDPDCADNDFCWCANGTYTATTNSQGKAYFYVSVGGCCETQNAWTLWLEGSYLLRAWNVAVSPAYEGTPDPQDCDVALADLSYFGQALTSGAPGCTDFDGNGATALPDFVIFGNTWGAACGPSPAPPEVLRAAPSLAGR
jgi:hypothetical protein